MLDRPPILTKTGLKRYVGVSEVCEALGYSRSTLDRMRRDKLFPKAEQISPNRVGWPVEVVTAFLDARRDGLAQRAVADPNDLAADQLAPTLRDLGARLVAHHIGEAVAPEQISLSITRSATNDEVTSCRCQFIERLEELCGHFEYDRALFLVAAVFPALRERLFEDYDPGHLRDPEVLREFAADACLDDEVWAALEKATKAKQAKTAAD